MYRGRPSYQGTLVPLLAEVSAAVATDRLLLIIDQFEDVLVSHNDEEVQRLLSELSAIHRLREPKLRVLISYRADMEGMLGEFWQLISGSPQGLPRVYLGGVRSLQAWDGVKATVASLSVELKLSEAEAGRIQRDLTVASEAAGFALVYPPYIQMLIDHIWRSTNGGQREYLLQHYQRQGGMEGVIGGYLNRQLEYAYDQEGHVRAVLVSLVRSYGVRAQRTLDEIVADTNLMASTCEESLERLIDLRLVRHVETYYEVSHDFIARRIVSELVDTEEREFKSFNELMISKSAAFPITKALLSTEELLMLYKHKERLVPGDEELRLILTSWLRGRGPGLYWVLRTDPTSVLTWLRSEESSEDLGRDEKVSNILLRKKLRETPLNHADYLAFRRYQLSAEMASNGTGRSLTSLEAQTRSSLPGRAIYAMGAACGLTMRRQTPASGSKCSSTFGRPERSASPGMGERSTYLPTASAGEARRAQVCLGTTLPSSTIPFEKSGFIAFARA